MEEITTEIQENENGESVLAEVVKQKVVNSYSKADVETQILLINKQIEILKSAMDNEIQGLNEELKIYQNYLDILNTATNATK